MTNCYSILLHYTCIYIYTPEYGVIRAIILFVWFSFSKLAIMYWTPNWCVPSQESLYLPNSTFLSCLQFCVYGWHIAVIPICHGMTSISDVKVIGGECTATNLLNQHNP